VAEVPSALSDELLAQSLQATLSHDFGRVEVELRGE
jgi:hypothetical protein